MTEATDDPVKQEGILTLKPEWVVMFSLCGDLSHERFTGFSDTIDVVELV